MKKLLLLAVLAGLITFSLITLVRRQNRSYPLLIPAKKPLATTTSEPTIFPSPAASPISPPAIIQGSLSYPSEGIPEKLKVCAQNVATQEEVCTSTHLTDPRFQYGVGYELQVAPGIYEVYAVLPGQPEFKAYYSEAVPCGLSVDCPSHQPILVEVAAGETVSNIDPQDWYAPLQE